MLSIMGEQRAGGMDIVGKADAVVSALAGQGEATVGQLAELVGEPVSSTYRLLTSLMRIGWVDKGSRRGLYRLGLFFMRIGGVVEDAVDIRERALPTLRTLLHETGETSYLCVRRGTRAVCIERLEGRDVRSLELRLGASLPLAIGAAPRCILAFLPDEERDSLLDQSLRETAVERGPLDRDQVMGELLDARRHGYVISDGDVTRGVAAIGAPVFNQRRELVGAISVSGVRERLLGSRREGIVRLLIDGAARVSATLGYRVEHAG
jgi:DNA-binding IclR family transcriptional regulator